jgi:hypothetical protein
MFQNVGIFISYSGNPPKKEYNIQNTARIYHAPLNNCGFGPSDSEKYKAWDIKIVDETPSGVRNAQNIPTFTTVHYAGHVH